MEKGARHIYRLYDRNRFALFFCHEFVRLSLLLHFHTIPLERLSTTQLAAMPRGNKKTSTTNKKKVNRRQNVDSTDTTTGSIAASPSTDCTGSNRAGSNTKNESNNRYPRHPHDPPLHIASPTGECTPESNDKKAGLSTTYDRYKQATQRFKNALEQMAPSIFVTNKTGVQSWLDAVDYLHTQWQQQDADSTLVNLDNVNLKQAMIDLKAAISVRELVAKAFFQGGDEGHSYFVEVLKYCRVVLKPIVKQSFSSSEEPKPSRKKDLSPIRNRFGAFSTEHVLDDSDTIDMTPLSSSPPLRPVPPANMKLSFKDLTDGDDRFCASVLLLSIEEMMQSISNIYRTMKQAWRNHFDTNIPSDTFVADLMEAATYVNFAIQQVLVMEEELSANYPYLNTVYRMMTFLELPDAIKHFTDYVLPMVSDRDSFLASHDSVALIGDVIESRFRSPDDDKSRIEPITALFCSKWKLEVASLSQYIFAWDLRSRIESLLIDELSLDGYHSVKRTWLVSFKNIGRRDHSMVNTIHLLQCLGADMENIAKGQPSDLKSFALEWDERRKTPTIVFGHTDSLMLSAVSQVLNACKTGMLSTTLPRELDLLTFFTVLKCFTASPEKAIPWSLAFAVHALRTSLSEMQGDDDMEKLGKMAKASFDKYFGQINSMIAHQNEGIDRERRHSHMVDAYNIRHLVPDFNSSMIERLVWSPLCSGLYMKYICFFGNLDFGVAMLDVFSQLRIVLHLFNAFVQIGAVRAGQIPFLDWLHNMFRTSKAVWGCSIPKSGEFVKFWWIACGASIPKAQQLAKAKHSQLRNRTEFKLNGREPRREARKKTSIIPGDIVVSFRHICLHNFKDVESGNRSVSQHRRNGSVLNDFAAQTNTILVHMKKEQRILASNFAVIGHLLNEHIIEVFDALEYTLETETPKKFCESDFRRHVLVHLLVDLILGPLDVEPNLNALLKFHPVPSLSRIAEIFIECFNKIQPSDFQFFTPPELRKGNRSEVLSVNRSDQCLGQHCTLPDCVWEGKNEDASTSKETFVDHQPLPLLPLLYSPGAVDLC